MEPSFKIDDDQKSFKPKAAVPKQDDLKGSRNHNEKSSISNVNSSFINKNEKNSLPPKYPQNKIVNDILKNIKLASSNIQSEKGSEDDLEERKEKEDKKEREKDEKKALELLEEIKPLK